MQFKIHLSKCKICGASLPIPTWRMCEGCDKKYKKEKNRLYAMKQREERRAKKYHIKLVYRNHHLPVSVIEQANAIYEKIRMEDRKEKN